MSVALSPKALPLLALLASCALPAAAEIYRCTTKGGTVTYQQFPCAASDGVTVLELPASFPPVDAEARQRLFEREAALDRRLEAQRERDTREAVARAMQPPPPQIIPEEPQLIWALPRFPFHHRGHNPPGRGSHLPTRG
jgi:hypothetical protein